MGDNNNRRLPFPEGRVITPEQIRAESCIKEIDIVMKKHNCRLVPQVTMTGEGVVSGTTIIIPNKKKIIANGN
ncbi:hypothetical protein LCGC14_0711580 [marine sediment metagenome]|uniref:Uncharacterized protein n=1 Tax=marine sediment metagenome TaxID=412755 RepID=A0A0F9TMG2_9ZZZZ